MARRYGAPPKRDQGRLILLLSLWAMAAAIMAAALISQYLADPEAAIQTIRDLGYAWGTVLVICVPYMLWLNSQDDD